MDELKPGMTLNPSSQHCKDFWNSLLEWIEICPSDSMTEDDCYEYFMRVVEHNGFKCACDFGNAENEADGSPTVDCNGMDEIQFWDEMFVLGEALVEMSDACAVDLQGEECKAAAKAAETEFRVLLCKLVNYFTLLDTSEEYCLENIFPEGFLRP